MVKVTFGNNRKKGDDKILSFQDLKNDLEGDLKNLKNLKGNRLAKIWEETAFMQDARMLISTKMADKLEIQTDSSEKFVAMIYFGMMHYHNSLNCNLDGESLKILSVHMPFTQQVDKFIQIMNEEFYDFDQFIYAYKIGGVALCLQSFVKSLIDIFAKRDDAFLFDYSRLCYYFIQQADLKTKDNGESQDEHEQDNVDRQGRANA